MDLRRKLLRKNFFGLDSIQGYLEMAELYKDAHVRFVCACEDRDRLGSMYANLLQLEQEGLISLRWGEPTPGHDGALTRGLEQIALTVGGTKLLAELKSSSTIHKVKGRLLDLLWAATTSVVTTLLVLSLQKK